MKPRNPVNVSVTEEDLQLFREAVGPVRPAAPVAAPPAPPKPRPVPRQRRLDELAVLADLARSDPGADPVASGEAVQYLKSGVAPRVLKALRRGRYAVQEELDLHGQTAEKADALLRNFLSLARKERRLSLRIIHGKGMRSGDQGPVLKQLTESLLRRRGDVLAFTTAPPAQGGTGAVLVLLKAPETP